MDEIERPDMPENLPLDIYDARVTFRKTGQGEKAVTVNIRYSKKGHPRKREFSEKDINGFFQEGISDGSLCWKLYHKEHLAVYHRRNKDEYIDMKHYLAQTDISQKLERLVFEAHKEFMKTSR